MFAPMAEPEKTQAFPLPAMAIAAGPFLARVAKGWGLGTVTRALVAGVGVALLAAALALIPAPRTRMKIMTIAVLVAAGAFVASLLADAF
jgi:hypothetical protein